MSLLWSEQRSLDHKDLILSEQQSLVMKILQSIEGGLPSPSGQCLHSIVSMCSIHGRHSTSSTTSGLTNMARWWSISWAVKHLSFALTQTSSTKSLSNNLDHFTTGLSSILQVSTLTFFHCCPRPIFSTATHVLSYTWLKPIMSHTAGDQNSISDDVAMEADSPYFKSEPVSRG